MRSAFLQLAGLGSAGIILVTNTTGERTMLPLCLCMLAALSWAGTVLLEKLPGKAIPSGVVIALSIVSFANIGRQLPGYWHNYQVEQENLRYEAEAAETGVLYYNTDYDRSCTHIKRYDDGYFYLKWKESTGADAEGYQVYFYREDRPNVYAGGVRTESPAIQGSSGWLLPLTGVANAMGGSLKSINSDWSVYTIRLQDQAYVFSVLSGDRIGVEWTDGTGTHQMEGEKSQGYYTTCVSLDIFT